MAEILQAPKGAKLAEILRISRDGKTLFTERSEAFSFILPDEPFSAPDRRHPLADLTGQGTPTLMVGGDTKGMHCCFTLFIFELGTQPKKIAELEEEDSGGFSSGLGPDGRVWIGVDDWIYNYWNYSFMESRPGSLKYSYRNGYFRPDIALSRTPAPDPALLNKEALEIRKGPDWEADGYPPPRLYWKMVELIYGGHAREAVQFFKQSWRPSSSLKENFFADFSARLMLSPHLAALKALNGPALEPFLEASKRFVEADAKDMDPSKRWAGQRHP